MNYIDNLDVFNTTAAATIPNYPSFTPETLKFLGAVAFGSRALGVHDKYSDYDFAILRNTYEKFTEHNDNFPELPLDNYFKVMPPNGNNTLIKCNVKDKQYDLLLVEHQEHLDIIKKSVEDIKHLPYKYTNKQDRIRAYERALLSNGFKLDWRYKVIRWFANLTKLNITKWVPNNL